MLNSFPAHLDSDDASADCADVTVRPATEGDADGIRQLEALEGREAGDGPHLVAERDGDVVACLSLAGGTALGDPFRPTAELVSLLKARARHLGRPGAAIVKPVQRVAARIAALYS